MRENKKTLFLITLVGFLGVFLIVHFCTNDKNIKTQSTDKNDEILAKNLPAVKPMDLSKAEWVEFESSQYGFSFSYPKGSFFETIENEINKRIRIQNYNPIVFNREIEGKYFVDFLFLSKDNFYSACHQDFEFQDFLNSNNVLIKAREDVADDTNDVGDKASAFCIDLNEYELYIQGRDYTGENILERVIDSLQIIN